MEVNDSGFSGTVETLRIQLLVDDSMLQVPVLQRNDHDGHAVMMLSVMVLV